MGWNPVWLPLPPLFKKRNGSRGARRASNAPPYRVVFIHTYSDGSTLFPMKRFLDTTASPAYIGRAFQSKMPDGRWAWERPDGTQTGVKEEAKPSTIRATVFNPPNPAMNLVPGMPMPWCYGAAYLAYADGYTEGYVETADPDEWTLNSQGGHPNQWGLSICIPGGNRSRAAWLSPWGLKQLRGVAKYIVMAHKKWGIPLHRATVDDLKAGRGGYCGHVDASRAFKFSDHGDPGPEFPYDVLETFIKELMEDDMALVAEIVNDDGTAADTAPWLLTAGVLNRSTEEAVAAFRFFGLAKPETVKLPRSALAWYRPLNGVTGPFKASDFLQ